MARSPLGRSPNPRRTATRWASAALARSAINPTLYANVGYDPRKDFAPVGLIATSGTGRAGQSRGAGTHHPERSRSPRRKPGKLTFASAGAGSGIHLAAEYFACTRRASRSSTCPYKGSGPALTDLIGGHVSMIFSCIAGAAGLVKDKQGAGAGGDRRQRSALSRTFPRSRKRPSRLRGGAALGIVGPPARPGDDGEAERRAQRRTGRRRGEERLAVEGAEALPLSPDDYATDIAKEEAKWSEMIRKSGMKGE